MPFQLRSKKLLLTYSQVTELQHAEFVTPSDAHFDFLGRLNGPPQRYRLGRESHSDGGIHFHCYAEWSSPLSTRNQSLLDYAGSHPNIQAIRTTPQRAWDYAGKDDDVIHEYGSFDGADGAGQSRRDSIWSDALQQTDKISFLEVIKQNAPRDYVIFNGQITAFADRTYAEAKPEYISPAIQTHGFGILQEWLEQSRINCGDREGRVKSLILWGPSLTGKTLWARSLGRYVYFCWRCGRRSVLALSGMRGATRPTPIELISIRALLILSDYRHDYHLNMFNLDDVDTSSEYAIFDDLMGGFEFFKSYKAWLGCQYEFTISDKYRRKQKIYWGKPSIWLTNDDPHLSIHVDHDWLEKNCYIVYVGDTLATPLSSTSSQQGHT